MHKRLIIAIAYKKSTHSAVEYNILVADAPKTKSVTSILLSRPSSVMVPFLGMVKGPWDVVMLMLVVVKAVDLRMGLVTRNK